jgi:hypothetical protein
VSGELQTIVGEVEDWIEEGVSEVEHLVKPRPGGKIDTAARMAEQHSDKDLPVAQTDTLIRGKPVAVDDLLPENGLAVTVTLNSANPMLQLLPRDTTRRSATILAIDNDVYISTSAAAATAAAVANIATLTGVGYLPAGIAYPWASTAPLYAASTTAAGQSRITVTSCYKGA